jgi:hypothetical protein
MTYAMTLDNSWELMTEDEMYDVNGGGRITITLAKNFVMGTAALIFGAGVPAALAAIAPTLVPQMAAWIAAAVPFGPPAVLAMTGFATAAIYAIITAISGFYGAWLGGALFDIVIDVASGFFIPNINLTVR